MKPEEIYPTNEQIEEYLEKIKRDLSEIEQGLPWLKKQKKAKKTAINDLEKTIDAKYEEQPSVINQIEIEILRHQILLESVHLMSYEQFITMNEIKKKILERACECLIEIEALRDEKEFKKRLNTYGLLFKEEQA